MRYNVKVMVKFSSLSILAVFFIVLLNASSVYAQENAEKRPQSLFSVEPADLKEGQDMDPFTGLPYELSAEPNFAQVEFLKIDPPKMLQERVDRLIQGIYIDIPPEIDHYGYEIRRYMAHIGNVDILKDRVRLEKEINNVKMANIILKYWRKELSKEMRIIQEALNEEGVLSQTRTSYQYNSGIVRAFFTEAQSWINNNENLLMFLWGKKKEYDYRERKRSIIFDKQDDFNEFKSLYKMQKKSLDYVNEYPPFMMMVY